jgi:lysophospholipid acyltransferase (LPLAT)-like uncharacterized protein
VIAAISRRLPKATQTQPSRTIAGLPTAGLSGHHGGNMSRSTLPTLHNSSRLRCRLHIAWGWLVALLWFALALPFRLTLRVRREGLEHLEAHPAHILAFWHCNLGIWFCTELRARRRQVWMQHPALFMTPVHAMLRLMGVAALAFGSSGSGGRQALREVIDFLRRGYATVITPDGPAGPEKELKPGVLIMSADSDAPVIPVSFQVSRAWRLPTWDRKILPKPFSTVHIRFHPPVHVADSGNQDVQARIEHLLNR